MNRDFNRCISSRLNRPFCRESTLVAAGRGRAKLGDEHPETWSSINNLGGLLQAQGKLLEAELLYRECLEKRWGAQWGCIDYTSLQHFLQHVFSTCLYNTFCKASLTYSLAQPGGGSFKRKKERYRIWLRSECLCGEGTKCCHQLTNCLTK